MWTEEDFTDEGIRRFLIVKLALEWKKGSFGVALVVMRLMVDMGPPPMVASGKCDDHELGEEYGTSRSS